MLCRLCFAIIVLCLASPRRALTRAYADDTNSRHRAVHGLARRGARIERLKLIRVYDRRHKASTECREKIGNLCAVPTVLYVPPSSHLQSLFQYSYLTKSRRSRALSFQYDYRALWCYTVLSTRDAESRIYERIICN